MKQLTWKKLLSEETIKPRTTIVGGKDRDIYDGRTPFDSDYDRIIFSYPFRRLQDKAQLFPLESNDFVRTRLTHSLEVAALAKSIGISISNKLSSNEYKDKYEWFDSNPQGNRSKNHNAEDLPKILECAGLVHDLGNPPFGHYGEETIGKALIKLYNKLLENEAVKTAEVNLSKQQQNDLEKFEGNSQSFRILTHLQCIKDEFGYHMTSALLASIMKYPVNSEKGGQKYNETDPNRDIKLHKFGYFFPEEEVAKKVFENTGLINDDDTFIRHPLAFILEAADDMAYSAGDVEDGFKKHIFDLRKLNDFFKEYNRDKNDNKIDDLISKIDEILKSKSYYSEEKQIQDVRIKIQQLMFHSIIETFFNHYDELMTGTFNHELIEESDVHELRECLKQVTKKFLYPNHEVVAKELMGKNIINYLVNLYYEGLFSIKEENKEHLVISFDKRIQDLISVDYLEVLKKNLIGKDGNKGIKSFDNIEINSNNVYYVLLLIADQISGMTDTYCMSLYKKLNAI